ncbi:MAG: TIGR03085 family metal-binding protein [Arthrobacter sp.]|uniref:TIGR03085 family metal-binding protein n=1 Tax=unclassified Arthrobacter TaxID=235627 RepID=UPI00265655C0|nr:TIGR03085 family metal-binding protein [Micrococcaceae bacterium]MDN5811593.1 TIGR03085 family metal-binding protein [Micrococcaceae bacterium]MDN5823652.1 TIGR03085 family metal-binding protein [Micrococcaceae bacterium]MDN5878799.1 TIGR03085 family metal-binding protein [Micrococcaceae bacterium]MDN5887855.1 TIGR03085 family metal-binding protein [Micrococcaceae bacterium]
MRYVHPSREVLAEVLLAAGPDEATLCAGWKTRHLAAHLVLREHSLWAAGIAIGAFRAPMERRLQQAARRAEDPGHYAELVDRFRRGPSALSPLALPSVGHAANLIEFFVHAEDVRRAMDRWAPRVLDTDYADVLWESLIRQAAVFYRGTDVGIILRRPEGQRHVVRKASTSVAITGDPGELLMHAIGRREHALVTFEGSPDALALFSSSEQ